MTIKILSDNIVNQIAAGEVIERPASVIKEMVENSIDAGASRVEISIRNGGASYISVSDNGCGMDKNDVQMSIKRHATSKMDANDLFHIRTFGFRGEALASISSIARVSIKSKLKGSSQAWELQVEGGKNEKITPAALNEGTKIEVRDLFFATPARLKFLKADSTESRYVRDVIEKIAMANPEVSIYLYNNDRKVLSLERSDAKSRISEVMGKEFGTKSIDVDVQVDDICVHGYIGIPALNKINSLSQYVFVNNRPVKDKVIMSAIRAGYMDVIEHGRYPIVALFVDVNPEEVDVNVHPAKTEVRFKDSAKIRSVIYHVIKEAIAKSEDVNTQTLTNVEEKFEATSSFPKSFSNFSPTKSNSYPSSHNSIKNNFADKNTIQYSFENTAPSVKSEVGNFEDVNLDKNKYFLGSAKAQLHKNYIVSQTEDSVFIIDQHAAHERIVYEKIKEKINNGGVETQNLLIPEILELKSSNIDVLLSKKDELYKIGLEIESFGDGTIIVRSLPSLLKNKIDVKALVEDLSEELLDMGDSDLIKEKLYEVCATIACHGSVRSGRILNISEMNELLRQMENCDNIKQCNHGRPTYVKLSLKDIEKLFNR